MHCQHGDIGSDDDAKTTQDKWLHHFVASREEKSITHVYADIANNSLHAASGYHTNGNATSTL